MSLEFAKYYKSVYTTRITDNEVRNRLSFSIKAFSVFITEGDYRLN